MPFDSNRTSGKLVIAAADPTGYHGLRQTTVFDDKPETYTALVLAHARIYCRSYAGEVVCLHLEQ